MIRSFRHKGLKEFFETGSLRGINAAHSKRLARILAFLDRASMPDDLNIPGWRLHQLHGSFHGFWSISVSGNWRIIFRFVESDVELVDYLDYH
ncbi:type II toxin-antitoxin system RelE/ParE family toxin [Phyllobacterium sp. SB3]|uniref:type II toxin-antitoxin system RelE/ParE family toxin n=1 Tax=Phyllobacterium sp. SB3 TaxID=3156073 RepID=UPI0032AF4DCD